MVRTVYGEGEGRRTPPYPVPEMRKPSAEDLEAVKLLLGDGPIRESFAPRPWRTWDVAGTNGSYRVDERPDTRNGGTYLFCPCPGWKFQMGKGKLCKHAQEVADLIDFQP